MQQAQITPRYVNQPKEAHWRDGSVKDANNQLWAVPKEALGYFQPGQATNIGYDPPMGNQRYPRIIMVNGQVIGGATAPAAGFTPVGQAVPQMPQPQPQFQPPPQPAPAPVQAPQPAMGPPAPAMPDTLLSNVLATAVEAKAITDPNQLESWAHAIANAHKAYHGILPQQPVQQPCRPAQEQGDPGPGIDDKIPFAPLRDLP